MSHAVLFTQCLQRDFVCPIGKYDELPNRLHVGWQESTRLMGETPSNGPVARMMRWAYEQAELKLVHIIDWHSADDPEQVQHIAHFGEHCMVNTPGAELAFKRPPEAASRETMVRSQSLNDFVGSDLQGQLAESANPTRAGIMGVWTEAKVLFLAYELRTRFPHLPIAVCSALCASDSRTNHFLALDQMKRILCIDVIDSIGEFQEFLLGASNETADLPAHSGFPKISLDDGILADVDRELLRRLFSHCQHVDCKALAGGFSGNLVLAAESRDQHGHEEAAHVVKIGERNDIGKERRTFESVEEVLGNHAPRISGFADLADRGAIKYRYASMSGDTQTFQRFYMDGLSGDHCAAILTEVFEDKLGRFYRASTQESVDLLAYYEYNPKWAGPIRQHVEVLIGGRAEGDTLQLPAGLHTPNLCEFYETDLPGIGDLRRDTVRFATVHGDLNGANVLLDDHENIWLIDFFHAHKGHILRDLIKLENDLLYIFTPLESDDDLRQAAAITDRLCTMEDIAAIPTPPEGLSGELARCWQTLATLRGFYAELVQSARNPFQWLTGALRYAVHTLSFEESSARQKAWALYAAGRYSDRMMHIIDGRRRLRLDNAPAAFTGSGRLSMTILPGRRDYNRELDVDLATMHTQAVNAVVCLVPLAEIESYGVRDLLPSYRQAGFEVYHLPIADQRACSMEAAVAAVSWCQARLDQGQHVMLHCVGGIGRTGLIGACVLKAYGADSDTAIEQIRQARTRRAIETETQERFVRDFTRS
jgi:protein-tyrosine phosphatase/nicotinamidase-related amidase